MSARVFTDANVLVYSRDSGEPAKQPRAEAWRRALWQSRAGRISVQVLQEYYVTVTRKLSPGMPLSANVSETAPPVEISVQGDGIASHACQRSFVSS